MGDGGLERLLLVVGGRVGVDVVRGMAMVRKERHAEGSRCRLKGENEGMSMGYQLSNLRSVFKFLAVLMLLELYHWLRPYMELKVTKRRPGPG